jgi:glycosyltransferase involved in cell wall biosynthesis
MNILFLPTNIASLPSITATALNAIEGIHAKNIIDNIHKYQSISKSTVILPQRLHNRLHTAKWLNSRWEYGKELKKWIEWADVLHYVCGPAFNNGADLRWAKAKNKTIVIEWVGSDIRDPGVLCKINPYYAKVINNGYEYKKLEQSPNRNKVQKLFARAGAIAATSPEISLFLNKDLFPEYHILSQRLNLHNFIPVYPSVDNPKPLIIHSPSAKIAKGTNFIMPVIEELKKTYDFEFVLLHDMGREKVLEIMQKADIFLDQIICGGYGMASTEAMAFGKPVMCYIMPQLFHAGLPKEFPVINTTPDTLKEQLTKLITNPQLRHDIGKQSRAYAEKHFDAGKIALQLLRIYQSALEKRVQLNA